MYTFNPIAMPALARFAAPEGPPLTWANGRYSSAPPVMSMQPTGLTVAPPMQSVGFSNKAESRQSAAKQKCIVIFDWDDTLFPTTTIVFNDNKVVSASKLRELGEAVYNLLAKYLKTFGAENVFIVTNGSKSWVLHSLKMISKQYQECFGVDEEKGRSEDYFAAIYNTLISSNSIPVVSAQDEYKYRYPQVMCMNMNGDFAFFGYDFQSECM